MAATAKVYLVGAGPGDPDLLTRKAVRVLQDADVVIYDRLVSAEALALGNPNATFIYAGKQQGQQEEIQAEIFDWLIHFQHRARTIVRLKGGDPMIFARGGEELAFALAHGFEVEVVPGISSALAAPALAGIPLTYRGIATSFGVIAGHTRSVATTDFSVYRALDTLVVLMGVENRDYIAASLLDHGCPPSRPVLFIENASTGRERIVEATLADVAAGKVEVQAPAVFIIGEVVKLHKAHLMSRMKEAVAQ